MRDRSLPSDRSLRTLRPTSDDWRRRQRRTCPPRAGSRSQCSQGRYPSPCSIGSTLPDSEGLYSPRWSPDGRFVAAVGKDLRKLVLFDFTTQHWQDVVLMDSVGHLAWSRKGEYIYFDAATKDGVSIYRVGARDHKLTRVAAIPPPIGLAFGLFGPWTGLAPDDSPLLMRDTSIQEIYALDWQLP